MENLSLEARIVALLDTFHDGQREKKARAIMVEVVTPAMQELREACAGLLEVFPNIPENWLENEIAAVERAQAAILKATGEA